MEMGLFVIGALVALVGIYLCITGAPPITSTGFWEALQQMPPRFIAGVLLLVIGGSMMGANWPEGIGGKAPDSPSSPAPSTPPASVPTSS